MIQIGDVVIADGKVGVAIDFIPDAVVVLTLDKQVVEIEETKCIFLDECLNDYINRLIARFGGVRVARKC